MPAESTHPLDDHSQLASELHDHLAQDLVAARLKLALAQKAIPPGPGQELVAEAATLVQNALNDTRELVARLEGRVASEHVESFSSCQNVDQSAPAGGDKPSQPLRVLLADDHAAVRRVLKRILETDATIQLVGEATSGGEAVEMVARTNPDVVLLDANMEGMSGREAALQIREQAPHVRIVGVSADQSHAAGLKAVGAVAVWTKGDAIDELHRAIRS